MLHAGFRAFCLKVQRVEIGTEKSSDLSTCSPGASKTCCSTWTFNHLKMTMLRSTSCKCKRGHSTSRIPTCCKRVRFLFPSFLPPIYYFFFQHQGVLEVNIDDITSKHARDLVDLGDVSKSVFQAAVVEVSPTFFFSKKFITVFLIQVERQLRYDVLAKWENTADFIYTIKKAGLDDSSSTYSGLQQSHSPGQTVPSSPKLTEVDVEMGDLTR